MSIDDILKEKDQGRARRLEQAQSAYAKAQGLVNVFQARVIEELVSAIRAINDPALGEPSVIPVTGPLGVNKRSIQVECNGSIHVTFQATVRCDDGAQEAVCEPITIIVSRENDTAKGIFQPMPPLAIRFREVPEHVFSIEPDRLKDALYGVVREL